MFLGDYMNKKLLLLCVLLSAIEIKPVVLETLALVGVAAIVRNKTVQIFSKIAWTQVRQALHACRVQLSASMPHQAQRLEQAASSARAAVCHQAVVGKQQVVATVIAFKARAQALWTKNPLVRSVEQSAMHSRATGPWQQAGTSSTGSTFAGQAAHKVEMNMNSTQYTQKLSGFFPRVTNIFQTGDPILLAQEIGKKKFWQGACVGSVGTAWLLKKNEQQKDQAK